MIPYKAKSKKIAGTSYGEIMHGAMAIFDEIKKQTKMRPYIRSAYFKKEKIFFDYFREHLFQKPAKERMRRLKYLRVACELMKNSKIGPIEKTESFEKKEILYRFAGLTAEKELFYVQIKEDLRKKKKYFMSCFPPG